MDGRKEEREGGKTRGTYERKRGRKGRGQERREDGRRYKENLTVSQPKNDNSISVLHAVQLNTDCAHPNVETIG